jgi:hypothetical protein
MVRKIPAVAVVFLCAGCASGPPDWVASPDVDNGFAATDCVRDSGKLSLDRQVALAKARAGVAKQYEARVKSMDRAYARLRDPGATTLPGQATPFEVVAKPVAEQMLGGLDPARVEYVEINDVRQLCAMVTVEPEQARAVFDKLVAASGETLDVPTSEALFQEFTGAAPPQP